MERKEVAVTRFFKVIISNFEHKLKLPPPISMEPQKEKSRRATLQSRLGTWEISLCNHSENDELICLNEGWPQFVDRHALSSGDFLFFVHAGDLHFHVYVFDPTACEKEFRDQSIKGKEALIPTGKREMGEDQISIRSKFIRIMLTGFRKRLRLPPAYCKKAIKHEKSKRAIIESCKGKWDVKVCRDDDGKIILKNGWPRFADEHDLSLGDLIVFEHIGNLHFNVVVCNNTGCEKQFLVESNNYNDEHPTINPKNAPLLNQRLPFFTHTMTHYSATGRKGQVTIPVEFVKSNNLWEKKGSILKDPQSGRKWRVQLSVRTHYNMTMCGRWHYFTAANKFKVGDVCTFQLDPTKSAASENIYFDVRISRNTNR